MGLLEGQEIYKVEVVRVVRSVVDIGNVVESGECSSEAGSAGGVV